MKTLFILVIRGYQLVLSPLLPPVCRFTPSCSQYFIDALRTHGIMVGTIKGIWRILRCNPFSMGGYDPVSPSVLEGGTGRHAYRIPPNDGDPCSSR